MQKLEVFIKKKKREREREREIIYFKAHLFQVNSLISFSLTFLFIKTQNNSVE